MTRRDEAVVAGARGTIGARFRLHGRDPAFGLDCVGVVAVAARAAGYRGEIPGAYALRGGNVAAIVRAFAAAGLVRGDAPRPGGFALFDGGVAQLHLAVIVPGGIVHADALLRRVVERPGRAPWPLLGCWHLHDDRGD
jgi:hypothetical protein